MSPPATLPRREPWREGHRLLARRMAEAPGVLRRALAAPPPSLGVDPARLRAIRTTGLGCSASHARYLAWLLADELSLPARFVPTGALLEGPPPGAEHELLVVFSQGLSPNARFALQRPRAWRRLVLVTAVDPEGPSEGSEERAALLRELVSAGALVLGSPAGEERGTLVRVAGALAGYATALVLARAIARALGRPPVFPAVDADTLVDRMTRAFQEGVPTLPASAWDAPLAMLASGAYAGLLENLRLKVVEGWLRAAPPVWELLAFAHGPFQQLYPGPALLLAFTRPDAPREPELLARLETMLDPELHRLLRLPATLPGPLAIFEHEARMNALLLERVAVEAVDQVRFPGRGRDAPLYELEPSRPGETPPKNAKKTKGTQPA